MRKRKGPHKPIDLDLRQATALAGLGQLDEGMRLAEAYAHSPTVPHWLYLLKLAGIFRAAKLEDLALDCVEQAHAEDLENSTVQAELALCLADMRADSSRAGDLLAELDRRYVCEILKPLIGWAKGLVALNLGKWRDAERAFLEFEASKGQLPDAAHMRRALDLNHAFLAIAYARMHDRAQAERHWKLAWPRLQAIKASRIIDRYTGATHRM